MSAQQKKYLFDVKTQYGLGLTPQNDEGVVDFYGGGASKGLEIGLVELQLSPEVEAMHYWA